VVFIGSSKRLIGERDVTSQRSR